MISATALKAIARARLQDARVLLNGNRFDGAFYLCGYAIELAIKAKICRTLKWNDFPGASSEFKGLTSLKTHDLEILLRLSGVEARIKTRFMAEWSVVLQWDPEKRYQTTGTSTRQEASDMIASVTTLLRAL